VLKRVYSDQVSYYLAPTRHEAEALAADLPRAIRDGLSDSLDWEGVMLRYDAPSRCAYHITREGQGLAVWIWCNLGLQASANLFSAIVELDGPMTEALALQVAQRGIESQGTE
jgi:hypothetical protein